MTDISEFVDRKVGDLTLRINRSLCVGFEHCSEEAPEAWELQDDDIVDFLDPETVERDRLIRSVEVCPVAALIALDADGNQLAP